METPNEIEILRDHSSCADPRISNKARIKKQDDVEVRKRAFRFQAFLWLIFCPGRSAGFQYLFLFFFLTVV
jgi:hypothetical protein